MFDAHGRAWAAALSGVLSAASLDAHLLVGRKDELVCLERFAIPLASVQIQHASGLGGEVRVAREHPTAVIPRPDRILVQPAP
jgi:hypothetical protein